MIYIYILLLLWDFYPQGFRIIRSTPPRPFRRRVSSPIRRVEVTVHEYVYIYIYIYIRIYAYTYLNTRGCATLSTQHAMSSHVCGVYCVFIKHCRARHGRNASLHIISYHVIDGIAWHQVPLHAIACVHTCHHIRTARGCACERVQTPMRRVAMRAVHAMPAAHSDADVARLAL